MGSGIERGDIAVKSGRVDAAMQQRMCTPGEVISDEDTIAQQK